MNALEIVAIVYGAVTLVVLARNVQICQRERNRVKTTMGTNTTFTEFIPALVKDAVLWPLLVLWYGLAAWFRDLE